MIGIPKLIRCLKCALLTACLTLLVSCLVISNVLGFIWHLKNGSSAVFTNWRVPIPTGYASPDGQSFFAFSFGAPFLNDSYGHITVFTHKERRELPYQQIEVAMVKVANDEGYRLEGKRALHGPLGSTYCFQFQHASRNSKVLVRCVTATGELAVFFEGDQRFSGDAYAVVAGIQRL